MMKLAFLPPGCILWAVLFTGLASLSTPEVKGESLQTLQQSNIFGLNFAGAPRPPRSCRDDCPNTQDLQQPNLPGVVRRSRNTRF